MSKSSTLEQLLALADSGTSSDGSSNSAKNNCNNGNGVMREEAFEMAQTLCALSGGTPAAGNGDNDNTMPAIQMEMVIFI